MPPLRYRSEGDLGPLNKLFIQTQYDRAGDTRVESCLMDLQQIEGELSDGLDRASLSAPVAALLARLPADYVEFLEQSDGITFESGGSLYSSAEIQERNATYEVADYEPGYVAIGDNGGGYLFLLKEGSASLIYLGGMGSLGSLPLEPLADSVTQWGLRASHLISKVTTVMSTRPGQPMSILMSCRRENSKTSSPSRTGWD